MKSLISTLLILCNCLLALAQNISYYGGIKAIFNKHCTSCHKKNGFAPFELNDYAEIVKYKTGIAHVLQSGYMPPWKPDPAYSHFIGERIMPASDKEILLEWLSGDCKKGDVKEGIATLAGKENYAPEKAPDLVLKMPFSINIQPSVSDTNVYIEIEYEIPKDTFISYYEFIANIRSNDKSGVHHAFFTIEDREHRFPTEYADEYYPHEYWDGKNHHYRTYTTRFMNFGGGWVPGQQGVQMPEGIGFRIPRKGMLIYMIHYGPSVKAYQSNFELRFNFSDKPVTRMAEARRFGTRSQIAEPFPALVIPPDSIMTFRLNVPMSNDYSIIAMAPHMHLLGKSFRVWMIKTNGDTVKIINIKDWDFNWQGYYFPDHLLKLDSGAVLQAEVVYDNTTGNFRNPNNPPRLVKYGQKTSDEMLEFNIYGVPYKKDDELLSITNK